MNQFYTVIPMTIGKDMLSANKKEDEKGKLNNQLTVSYSINLMPVVIPYTFACIVDTVYKPIHLFSEEPMCVKDSDCPVGMICKNETCDFSKSKF